MATTMTDHDESADATKTTRAANTEQAASGAADTGDSAEIADQATRVDELRSDFDIAEERSETARQAYLAGVQAGAEPDDLKALRRAWDGARAARNAVETLVMVQDAAATASEANRDEG